MVASHWSKSGTAALDVSRSMERLSQRPQRIQSLRIIVARQSPASIQHLAVECRDLHRVISFG